MGYIDDLTPETSTTEDRDSIMEKWGNMSKEELQKMEEKPEKSENNDSQNGLRTPMSSMSEEHTLQLPTP